jgi:ferredoxin
VPIASSEFTLKADMVVQAIGQSPDLSLLGQGHRFAITREGTFNIDRVSYMTNRPGVFAAGDAITQPVSVIDAIGSARQAAAGIDAYLRGVPAEEVPISAREVPIARRDLLPEELTAKPRHASPTIPMARRLHSYAEVEIGYDAESAIAEAQRCLTCGPCSECLACEAVCEPNAILHDQQEQFEQFEVGAIIWADETAGQKDAAGVAIRGALDLQKSGGNGQEGIYQVKPDDPLAGSAAAARAMMELFSQRQPAVTPPPMASAAAAARIGVFICQCNGQISEVVDTAAVEDAARTWNGVAYSQVLAQSCSPEAARSWPSRTSIEWCWQPVPAVPLTRFAIAAPTSGCAARTTCWAGTLTQATHSSSSSTSVSSAPGFTRMTRKLRPRPHQPW